MDFKIIILQIFTFEKSYFDLKIIRCFGKIAKYTFAYLIVINYFFISFISFKMSAFFEMTHHEH